MKRLLILLTLLPLLGSLAVAEDNTATVYIYRYAPKGHTGLGWGASLEQTGRIGITVDDAKVAGLKGEHYVTIRLPAGTHVIGAQKPYKLATSEVQLSAGESYFFRLNIHAGWSAKGEFENVDRAVAIREMQETKHQTDHVDVPLWLTAEAH